MGLRLCSDDRPRAKPSGFRAPTTVQGRNPQGSELRRPSKGKNPQGYFPYDRWGLMYQKGLPDMLAATVGMIELDIEDIDARSEARTVPADLSLGG